MILLARPCVRYCRFPWFPADPTFGGYFILVPISTLALVLPFTKQRHGDGSLWGFGVLSLFLAVFILLVNCKNVGISTRYFGDFGLLTMISAACAYLFIDSAIFAMQSGKLRTFLSVAFQVICVCLLAVSALVFSSHCSHPEDMTAFMRLISSSGECSTR